MISGARRILVRLVGFFAIPALTVLSPILVLPAITGILGPTAWASVAVSQSLGSAAGVVVELGWGLNGPQRVARARTSDARARIYCLALSTMGITAAVISVPLCVAVNALVHGIGANGYLIAIATALGPMGPIWYFVGSGQPRLILLLDTIPTLCFTLAAAACIGLFHLPLITYSLGLLLAAVVPIWLAWSAVGGSLTYLRRMTARRLARVLFAQATALQARVASAIYIALPITLVGAAMPSAVVEFSAAERVERLYLTFLQAFPNAMQSWVGGAPPDRRRHRVLVGVLGNAAFGLVAGTVLILMGPLVIRILFADAIHVSMIVLIASGTVVAITCTSRATGGLGLVAYRSVGTLRSSAIAGAIIGLPAIAIGARLLGVLGGMLGEIVAEATVLMMQLLSLARIARGRSGKPQEIVPSALTGE